MYGGVGAFHNVSYGGCLITLFNACGFSGNFSYIFMSLNNLSAREMGSTREIYIMVFMGVTLNIGGTLQAL